MMYILNIAESTHHKETDSNIATEDLKVFKSLPEAKNYINKVFSKYMTDMEYDIHSISVDHSCVYHMNLTASGSKGFYRKNITATIRQLTYDGELKFIG